MFFPVIPLLQNRTVSHFPVNPSLPTVFGFSVIPPPPDITVFDLTVNLVLSDIYNRTRLSRNPATSKSTMLNPRRCGIFILRSAKCSNVNRLPLALHWSLIDDLTFRFQGERPVPWELRVEMASESPTTASPHEEEDFEDVDQVELLQPKLSLSIVAEDTLEVRGRESARGDAGVLVY